MPSVFILIALIFFTSPVLAQDERETLIYTQLQAAERINQVQGTTLTDGSARVYQVKGKARLLKKGSPVERDVKKGDEIQAGDAIFTGQGASVSIAFDVLKQNAVQIPPATRAFFDSIEPTDIRLEEGSVFSAVDGLPQGSSWKITTPSAVAAVRGTVYLVRFQSASGEFYAATVDIPDDKQSSIEIKLIEDDGEANVPEGKEITLREGEPFSSDLIQDLSPEAIAEIQQFFDDLQSEREEAEEQAGQEAESNAGGMSDFGSDMDKTEPPTMENQPELDSVEDFGKTLAEEPPKKDDSGQQYPNCGTNC